MLLSTSIVTVKLDEGNQTKDIIVTDEEKYRWGLSKGLKVALRSNRIVGAGENASAQDTDYESASNFMLFIRVHKGTRFFHG
jgi:hypothetical protein